MAVVTPDMGWWCPSNGHPTASFTSHWGTGQGGTAPKVVVITWPAAQETPPWNFMAVPAAVTNNLSRAL
jgi:hypothetical protein